MVFRVLRTRKTINTPFSFVVSEQLKFFIIFAEIFA